jgi:integrase
MRSPQLVGIRTRFPARTVPVSWPATATGRAQLVAQLQQAPYVRDNARTQAARRLALLRMLDWLEQFDGATWQQRWDIATMAAGPDQDWRCEALAWLRRTGKIPAASRLSQGHMSLGLGQLIHADVIRPSLHWLLTSPATCPLREELARVRDVEGFAAATRAADRLGSGGRRLALHQIALIVAAKGDMVADITVGDCLELMELRDTLTAASTSRGVAFYQVLHTIGVLPPDAPATLRMLSPALGGQLTPAELIDFYGLASRPVRNLLVDYLCERQAGIDHVTLRKLAHVLGGLFWKDLEDHNPGIDSLRLTPQVAAAWKQRLAVKTVTQVDAQHGPATKTTIERLDATGCLIAVRMLYRDIAQWAGDDPARWGPWALPCPIRDSDINIAQQTTRTKSRMDQRTRERLPVMPALEARVTQARRRAAELLSAAHATLPGQEFTHDQTVWRRAELRTSSPRAWAIDPARGNRIDLTQAEDVAFWTWAAVEVLRHTGIRIEELTELTHHSLIQYRLPDTGQLVPLLHIAPSKTDIERLLVISPELADVLAAIVARIRDTSTGTVPDVIAYDRYECCFLPPMPVLFQRLEGMDRRPLSPASIRRWIRDALTATQITDAAGKPLVFTPHDFRRIFATEAIMNGMPPHIAQLVLGHKDITTTMGYKAVYPDEAIAAHRAFIARRRELRPPEEYRTPTEQEWQEFLGHFQRRKVELGDCGRAYQTACHHEHACIRCALLHVDPAQRDRLTEIRDSLQARISEVREHGWLGEVEGLQVSLAATNDKIAHLDLLESRRSGTTDLGMPSYPASTTHPPNQPPVPVKQP